MGNVPPPPQQYAGAQATGRTNGMAIASMVLGIIGLLIQLLGIIPLLAVIFGFVGKSQIDRSGGTQRGKGMAIAGIILGFIGIAITAAILIWVGTNPTLFQGGD